MTKILLARLQWLWQRLDGFCSGRWFGLVWIPVAILFLLRFSPTTSPLYDYEGDDSAVFKSMGQAVLHGKVIYRDLFDNKGPALYFIDALGLWMGGRWGLLALQVVGLSVALWSMFRTARLFAGGWWSAVSVGFALWVSTVFFQEGNQCEEWAMYAFAVVLYVVMRWFHDLQADVYRALQRRRLAWLGGGMGIALAITTFIRPNDGIAFVGGLMLSVGVLVLCKGRLLDGLRYAGWAAAGAIVGSLPFLAYFAYHHAMGDLWNGMVGLNLGYENRHGFSLMLPIEKLSLALCVAALWVVAWYRGRGWLLWMVGVPTCLMFVLTGHRMYLHYFLPFVPWIVMGMAMGGHRTARPAAVVAVLALLMVPLVDFGERPLGRVARQTFTSHYTYLAVDKNYHTLLQESEALAAIIPEDEQECVWNDLPTMFELGAMFTHNNIVQCNRVIFSFKGNPVFDQYIDQRLAEVEPLPLWVVARHGEGNPLLHEADSPYALAYTTTRFDLFRLVR